MGIFDNARNQARKSIELLYEHTCNTFEYRKVKNTVTKITSSEDVIILENQPCKLSYYTIKSTNQTENAGGVVQVIKLFIAPEVIIKPGSKIIVTHNGITESYKNSGVPAVFSSHQEIVLELFKGWA
jgi:hypothetical protein